MGRRRFYWLVAVLLILACNLPRFATTPAVFATRTKAPPTETPGPIIESTRVVIVELPIVQAEVDGALYQVFQGEGDPFRFLCPSPCAGLQGLIYPQYAGFKAAREMLLKLTGIDTLRELEPVDIHLLRDPKCPATREGAWPSYSGHDPGGSAYICSFIFESPPGTTGLPYTPQEALLLDHQTALIHEYMRTMFFGRVENNAGAMNDFTTPFALLVTGTLGGTDLCAYHPTTPPGDYGGYLLYNLCRDNDFRADKLAPALVALDRLYRRDDGRVPEGYEHPSSSGAQFREVINDALPGDVREGFRDACWPADLFEDIYSLRSNICTLPRPTVEPTPVGG